VIAALPAQVAPMTTPAPGTCFTASRPICSAATPDPIHIRALDGAVCTFEHGTNIVDCPAPGEPLPVSLASPHLVCEKNPRGQDRGWTLNVYDDRDGVIGMIQCENGRVMMVRAKK